MKKIPTIFKRNPQNLALVTDEVNPVCLWVFDGEGVPTRKWDGTATMILDHVFYKRYDCKKGRTPPPDSFPADEPDSVSGHWPHWIPVGDGPEDRWHREGYANFCNFSSGTIPEDGTFELLHPRFQGRDSARINPENVKEPILVRHGYYLAFAVPSTFGLSELKHYLETTNFEGIVWHHPDGRMAKIKLRDFGLTRHYEN